jgi:hypothetical protein
MDAFNSSYHQHCMHLHPLACKLCFQFFIRYGKYSRNDIIKRLFLDGCKQSILDLDHIRQQRNGYWYSDI